MCALIMKRPDAPLARGRNNNFVIVIVLLVCALCSGAYASEPLYPVALMNWMVEGTFHALVVDKSQQRLDVWQIKDGEPTLLESFRCATGENDGDKWVRGDMRTPEGVYFFCSVIDGKTLPSKYGPWAFTTDYPNFVDRRRGKNGDGIWLHGRDKPINSKPDSNGCVALENQDLVKVSRYVRLQSTPLIVVDYTRMAPRSAIMDQERELRNFIEKWRQSWESKHLDAYMENYSPNFQSSWLDFKGWKEKKRRLNKRYSHIKVKLGNVYLYRQDGLVTAIFTQSYGAEGFDSYGVKILYITDHGKPKIYAEDYHQAVDEACPARPLLARYGEEPVPVSVEKGEKRDYRIRLVSTDEPDSGAMNDTETPLPSAPSQAIVLQKVAHSKPKEAGALALETNDKYISSSSPQRLVISRVVGAGAENATDDSVADSDGVQVNGAGRRTAIAMVVEEKPEPPARATVEKKKEDRGALRIAQKTTDDKKNQLENQFDKAASEGSSTDIKPVDRNIIIEFLNKWKVAWEQKDLDRFMKMYHPEYEQGELNFKALRKSKQNFFRKYQNIHVAVDDVEIKRVNNRTEVSFIQSFQGDKYRDKGRKIMVLDIRENKGIRIISEDWTPISRSASNSGS
jgi:murein L,D-transpeptidase YafK